MTSTAEPADEPTGPPVTPSVAPRRVDAALLVLPLRLFMGVAWLRVGIANLSSPLWRKGDLVQRFSVNQDVVALPFALWILDAAGRHVVLVAWVVGITEVLCGLALLAGVALRIALAAAMTLNLVFLVCGQVNPSVFYLVIEACLLFALLSGAVGGRRPVTARVWWTAAAAAAGVALVLVPFVETVDPEELIFDPGAVLACFFAVFAVGAGALARQGSSSGSGRAVAAWIAGRWRTDRHDDVRIGSTPTRNLRISERRSDRGAGRRPVPHDRSQEQRDGG
jgi:thiosulfate dehydrogenase [quinone] large subunit